MALQHWKGDVRSGPSFFDRLMGWDSEDDGLEDWEESPVSAGISAFLSELWPGGVRKIPRVIPFADSSPDDDLLVTKPPVTNDPPPPPPVSDQASAETSEVAQQAAPDYTGMYRGLTYPQLRSMMQKFGARDPRDPARQHLDAAISQYNTEHPDNQITPMVVDNLVTRYTPSGQPRRVPTIAEVAKIRDPAIRRAFASILANPALAARMYAPDVRTVDPNASGDISNSQARSLIDLLQQKLRREQV